MSVPLTLGVFSTWNEFQCGKLRGLTPKLGSVDHGLGNEKGSYEIMDRHTGTSKG